jgi:hypothetical protein
MACDKAKLKDFILGLPDPAQSLRDYAGDHATLEDLDCSNHEHDDDTMPSDVSSGLIMAPEDVFGTSTGKSSTDSGLLDNDGIPKLAIANLWNNPIAVNCIRHRTSYVRNHRLLQILMDKLVPLTNPIPLEHVTNHEKARKNSAIVEPSDLMKAHYKEVENGKREAEEIQRLDLGSSSPDDDSRFFSGFEQVGL